MATVRFRNLKKSFEIRVTQKLKKVTKDKKTLNEIGKFSQDRIKAMARRGKPLRDGMAGKFPQLSKATVAIRKFIAKYNSTHQTYGANGKRKNVTITGQLVEAVKFKIKNNNVRLFIKGRRQKYRNAKGKVMKNQESDSANVYKNLIKLNPDYRFLGMDELGEKRIKNIIKRNLRRLLK